MARGARGQRIVEDSSGSEPMAPRRPPRRRLRRRVLVTGSDESDEGCSTKAVPVAPPVSAPASATAAAAQPSAEGALRISSGALRISTGALSCPPAAGGPSAEVGARLCGSEQAAPAPKRRVQLRVVTRAAVPSSETRASAEEIGGGGQLLTARKAAAASAICASICASGFADSAPAGGRAPPREQRGLVDSEAESDYAPQAAAVEPRQEHGGIADADADSDNAPPSRRGGTRRAKQARRQECRGISASDAEPDEAPPKRRAAQKSRAAARPPVESLAARRPKRAVAAVVGRSVADSDAESDYAPPLNAGRSALSGSEAESLPDKRPRRAAAVRGEASRSATASFEAAPLTLADSGAESSWSEGAAGQRKLASGGDGSRRNNRGVTMMREIGTDADPEVEEWDTDLLARGKCGTQRSAFSRSALSSAALRTLPDTTFLAGRAVYDADGKVNLHLLLGAHHQLRKRPEECDEEAARHVGWLARRACKFGLVQERELQRGKIRRGDEDEGAGESSRLLIFAENELRFPTRPGAAKRKNPSKADGELFSDDGEQEDDVERFVRRRQAAMALRARNDARRAGITAKCSLAVDMTKVQKALLAPNLSFDMPGQAASSDEEPAEDTLEITVPELKQRDALKQQLQRSQALALAKELLPEANARMCPGGHLLKPLDMRLHDLCGKCSGMVSAGEQALVCKRCQWSLCSRCLAQEEAAASAALSVAPQASEQPSEEQLRLVSASRGAGGEGTGVADTAGSMALEAPSEAPTAPVESVAGAVRPHCCEGSQGDQTAEGAELSASAIPAGAMDSNSDLEDQVRRPHAKRRKKHAIVDSDEDALEALEQAGPATAAMVAAPTARLMEVSPMAPLACSEIGAELAPNVPSAELATPGPLAPGIVSAPLADIADTPQAAAPRIITDLAIPGAGSPAAGPSASAPIPPQKSKSVLDQLLLAKKAAPVVRSVQVSEHIGTKDDVEKDLEVAKVAPSPAPVAAQSQKLVADSLPKAPETPEAAEAAIEAEELETPPPPLRRLRRRFQAGAQEEEKEITGDYQKRRSEECREGDEAEEEEENDEQAEEDDQEEEEEEQEEQEEGEEEDGADSDVSWLQEGSDEDVASAAAAIGRDAGAALRRHHRQRQRERVEEAQRHQRRLRFELADAEELGRQSKTAQALHMGTAAMTTEDRQRWDSIVGSVSATCAPTAVGPRGAGKTGGLAPTGASSGSKSGSSGGAAAKCAGSLGVSRAGPALAAAAAAGASSTANAAAPPGGRKLFGGQQADDTQLYELGGGAAAAKRMATFSILAGLRATTPEAPPRLSRSALPAPQPARRRRRR